MMILAGICMLLFLWACYSHSERYPDSWFNKLAFGWLDWAWYWTFVPMDRTERAVWHWYHYPHKYPYPASLLVPHQHPTSNGLRNTKR